MVYVMKYLGNTHRFTIRNKPIYNKIIEKHKPEYDDDEFIEYGGYPMRMADVDDMLFSWGYFEVKSMTKKQKLELLDYLDWG